jgi:hypothetical protein
MSTTAKSSQTGFSGQDAQRESERAFSCGNSKYYVVERGGCFIVRRQDWLTRTFIGYAHDIAEALTLIRQNAGSVTIRTIAAS